MKKTILLLVAFMFLGIVIKAQVNKTIECTAGNLSTLLTTTEQSTVTNLTVTGTMDARDFNTIQGMTRGALSILDLTAVTVAAYTGTELTYSYSRFYPANEIPVGAFEEALNLTSIILPNSITSIGEGAFDICENLISINISASVISIGEFAFSGCSAFIIVDENSLNYSSADGVLFNKTKTELKACPISKKGTYVVPSSVSIIKADAFLNCNLSSVTILSTNLIIEEDAFSCFTDVNSPLSVIKVYTAPENLIATVDAFGTNSTLTTSGTLYVPQGMKNAYLLAAGWNKIKNISEYSTTPTLSTSVKITIEAAQNNTISMDITSNSAWQANSNASWLTVNQTSGTGNTSLSISAAANTTAAQRTATLTVSGNGLSPQTLIVTQKESTTGMADLENTNISIFPNPTNSVLYINGFTEKATVLIYDLNGKLVFNKQITDNQIDVSNLVNGIYTLKVSDSNGVSTSKFLKN